MRRKNNQQGSMALPIIAGGALVAAAVAILYIMFGGPPKVNKYEGLQKIAPSLVPKTIKTGGGFTSPTTAPSSGSDTTTTIEKELNAAPIDDFDKDFKEMDTLIGGL